MSKDTFVEILKKQGYGASIQDGMVTIEVVAEDVKNTFIAAKLLANKVGYKHTIRVKRLEEATEDDSNKEV